MLGNSEELSGIHWVWYGALYTVRAENITELVLERAGPVILRLSCWN